MMGVRDQYVKQLMANLQILEENVVGKRTRQIDFYGFNWSEKLYD